MKLVKVTSSWLVVKYSAHCQAIILCYPSVAFAIIDCFFNISSLCHLWLLSHIFSPPTQFPPLPHFPFNFPVSLACYSECSSWAIPSRLWLQPPLLSLPLTELQTLTANYLLILLLGVPLNTPFHFFLLHFLSLRKQVISLPFKLDALDYLFLPLSIISSSNYAS